MKIVVISGSPRKISNTKVMMQYVFDYLKSKNHEIKFVDLSDDRMDCYRGPEENYSEVTKQNADDLTKADVWLVGSPIYNSFFSSALKNLFEYISYKETPGKVAGLAIMASGSISFSQVQSLLTQMMSYFRIVTNPKAVQMNADMVSEGKITDQISKERLEELVDETLRLAEKLG